MRFELETFIETGGNPYYLTDLGYEGRKYLAIPQEVFPILGAEGEESEFLLQELRTELAKKGFTYTQGTLPLALHHENGTQYLAVELVELSDQRLYEDKNIWH